MEYTSLNPFVPNASVFRRPDGVFEIYLHLPGIISDLEVTPFSSYLLVSGRHSLLNPQSEDGREADLVWSDQPCGYFGRDIPLGMNNATELIMLGSSSCQNSHVLRFSIRQKEVSTTGYCGEVMQRGELTSATDTRLFRGHHVAPSTAQDAENSSHSNSESIIYHDASARSNVGITSRPVHQPLPNSSQHLATEENLRKHVTFDVSSTLPHSTSANDTGIHELPASSQELPIQNTLSNERTVEAPHNPEPVAPVSDNHDQTPVPVRFPDGHPNHAESSTDDGPFDDLSKAVVTVGGGICAHSQGIVTSAIQDTTHSNASLDRPTMELLSRNFEMTASSLGEFSDSLRYHAPLNSSGGILTSPAQDVVAAGELAHQVIMRDSANGESLDAQKSHLDVTEDGPSGYTLAGSSDEKVLASSSQRESASVTMNVPDSLQQRLPENGDQQPSASTKESAERRVEFSADRDSRRDPSINDSAPTDAINLTLESCKETFPSQTIRGPTEGGSEVLSMQQNVVEALFRNYEPPHETHAASSTSTSAAQNPLNPSDAVLHHPATEKEDGTAAVKDPIIPQAESLVDRGSVPRAPPDGQVEAASPQKDADDKLPATSQNGLGSDISTTENNVEAPSPEEGYVAVPVHKDESPCAEPTDSTHAMNISTESLDDGLVKVLKDRGEGGIDTTPRQTPEESNSVGHPFANAPTSTSSNTPLSYAQVAKKPHADHTSRNKSGSPQSSYDFFTGAPDVSNADEHNLSISAEPPTQAPSEESTEKTDESTYDFVSPHASSIADRNFSMSAEPSTQPPSDKSTEKADGTSTSISDGLRDILAGDTGGQSSDLVIPSHPLSLVERSLQP